ncbi:MAG: N-acetylmuramoyl-L-alanine amidase [Armatimonadetes bacterium]|nr:N-acetylmuramoyl-L-alanine amidase [Armatimonadota bacterium]MDE2207725.1 N-acetylmuramoyl-L-alanine amidase [Armatimonadota bacterium]
MMNRVPVRCAAIAAILWAAASAVAMPARSCRPASRTRVLPPIVCIDPGHSAATVGARGRHSAEYRVAWHIALLLRRALLHAGCSVVLTKTSAGENVSNRARARIANRAHAALFLRLHCDAGSATGAGIYYPAIAGTIRGVSGPPAYVRIESRSAASLFHHAFIAALHGALHDRGIMTDMQTQVGRRLHGALEGSIYARVPVILVEMCVLTNPHDEAFITSTDGAGKMVRALAAGALAVTNRRLHHRTSGAQKPAIDP